VTERVADTGAVYDRIRRAIVEGRYPPGARLVEQRLAEELDVSRTPVREAVRRLESEGLVVVARHRGAHVRPLTEDDVADLYEVRARLEAYAAELAAARAEPDDVAELRAAAEEFAAAVAARRPGRRSLEQVRRLDAANARFHGTLHRASRHGRIRQLVAGAVDAPLVFQALQRFAPAELERSALFHELIADAVAAGEGARAGRLMTEHVLQGRDALLARLADAGGVADLFARSA
jgi:DNA-binding GntR family transcriptional regulator